MVSRVVPWLVTQEWEAVRAQVRSFNRDEWSEALKTLRIWKARFNNYLPNAVVLTIEILSALVTADPWDTDLDAVPKVSNEAQALAMAMALVRFVNVMSEGVLTGRKPLHQKADEIGIPAWIVDLRHEATHTQLPSTTLLHRALDFCIKYLLEKYWIQNKSTEAQSRPPAAENVVAMDTNGGGPAQSKSTSQIIEDIIVEFQQEQFQAFQRPSDKKTSPRSQVLSHNERLFLAHRDLFCQVLINQDGWLIFTDQQLKALHIHLNAEDDTELSPVLKEFWEPIFLLCSKDWQLYSKMVATLLRQLGRESNLRNFQIACWIAYLIRQGSLASGCLAEQVIDLISMESDFSNRIIINVSEKNEALGAKISTIQRLHKILRQTTSSSAAASSSSAVKASSSAVSSSSAVKAANSSRPVYTAERLKTSIRKSSKRRVFWKKLQLKYTDWSRVPIGTVFGQGNQKNPLQLLVQHRNSESDCGTFGDEQSVSEGGQLRMSILADNDDSSDSKMVAADSPETEHSTNIQNETKDELTWSAKDFKSLQSKIQSFQSL